MAVAASAPGQTDSSLRERFARDGYVVVNDVDLLDAIDAESIWEHYATFFAGGGDRVQDAWPQIAAVRAIATHPSVMATLHALYGREPVPFQTLNFLNGSQQRTHSDTIHFSSFPSGFMCGVWVALEDVTLEQGPLHYYPGTHALPECDYQDLGIPVPPTPFDWANPLTRASYAQYEDRIEQMIGDGGFARRELAIRRGAYLVWSANLFHGGSPIVDRTRTRKSQVTHYFFKDTVPYTPMFSKRTEGRFLIRAVRNIATGGYTLPTLDGRAVLFERTPDGLRKMLPATSLPQRALWHIVRHRPLPDTDTFRSVLRERLQAIKHAAFSRFRRLEARNPNQP